MSEGAAGVGALRARKTWRTLEPLHGMVYFVPEAAEAYGRLGISGRAVVESETHGSSDGGLAFAVPVFWGGRR